MEAAVALLKRCTSPVGFVAAAVERDNYRRVWGRDGCICALAALACRDDELLVSARQTLETLATHQGPSGQLPSNVDLEARVVSYGSTGRVDATIWFVLTACLYGRLAADDELLERLWPVVERAEAVVRAWEFNDDALVYVPQTGDWADEYSLSGYLLYDQALRLWAARELELACERIGRHIELRREAALIAERIIGRFTHRRQDGSRTLLAGFHAGAQHQQFDAFGSALCCLLEVGDSALRQGLLEQAVGLSRFDLVPAFAPTIGEGDPGWDALLRAAATTLRNRPGRYHNGGLWPMLTGFWAMAARRLGAGDRAERWQRGIARANALGDGGFHEYLDASSGEPGGTRLQAWSAAAEVIAAKGGGLL